MIDTVRGTGKTVLWVCDPMHGNTRTLADGTKTRHFDDIVGELEQAFSIHRSCGTFLGGVHIELTGDDVTECLGGARNLVDADLKRAYMSEVDPRLNYEQALEIAILIARIMKLRTRVDTKDPRPFNRREAYATALPLPKVHHSRCVRRLRAHAGLFQAS